MSQSSLLRVEADRLRMTIKEVHKLISDCCLLVDSGIEGMRRETAEVYKAINSGVRVMVIFSDRTVM